MPRDSLFKLRRDTAANWTSTNPTLAAGEPGVETDTKKWKVGDGSTAWNSLGYFGSGASFAAPSLTLGTSNTAGSSGTVLATDSTILAFDATSPSTQAFGDSAVVGTAGTAARRDHKHAMPATPTSVSGNAGTATALQTPRTINGTSFDGTANITTPLGTLTRSPRSSNTILAAADRGTVICATAAYTQTLTAAATLGAGWWVIVKNDTTSGTVVLTVTPNGSETIDSLTPIKMYSGETRLIECDGANFTSQLLEGGYAKFTPTGGSFTVPAGITALDVVCIGSGGQGGGGSSAVSTIAAGGGGGGGGAVSRAIIRGSDVTAGATVTVTVDAGGSAAGGGGTTRGSAGSNNGTPGTDGAATTFGALLKAGGGGGGPGGTTANQGGGAGGSAVNSAVGTTGGSPTASPAIGSQSGGSAAQGPGSEWGGAGGGGAQTVSVAIGGQSMFGGPGGGGGGKVNGSNVGANGGAGGTTQGYSTGSGGSAGTGGATPTGGSASNGTTFVGPYCGSAGGGGGAGSAVAGKDGGAAGIGAGGGGGGASSHSSSAAAGGNGGAGGAGEARVWYQ